MPRNLTEWLGLAAFLAFLAMFLHSLWRHGTKVAPVRCPDTEPSGIGGWLMLIIGCAFSAGIFNLAAFANFMTEISPLMKANRDGAHLFFVYALPAALGFLGYFWATLRLIAGRRPCVRWEATLGIWISGPVTELLCLLLWQKGLDSSRLLSSLWVFAILSVFSVLATTYFFMSRRVANTYGS